ncbi:MAG: S49 family peptidase [Actinobacteria bacterium]|nr:S49 family peptidase [Actinomycetota bacterium]
MPNLKMLQDELKASGSPQDALRRKYIQLLAQKTGRNVIVYYSGWLHKVGLPAELFSLNDADKNGFMSAIHKLDRSKGLDLVLHTPGGEIAATESLVDYLRLMFDTNIRAVVPQLAMSAGTMIALSCKSILMGKQSSLGPIDPQIGGIPAHGVIEEFERASQEIAADPSKIPVWQPIIAKYTPTLVGECEKATLWAQEIVKTWLISSMFYGDAEAEKKAERIVTELSDHAETKSHSRHISTERAQEIGVVVEQLEDDNELQDAVLSLHHACALTLSSTGAVKIIENHDGTAYIQQVTIQPAQ